MSEEQQQNSGHNAIQVKGDKNILLLQMDPTLASLAESQMQVNFYRATGIHCRKRARTQLEDLLDNHGFTVREVRRVWNSGAMTHNRKLDVFEFHSRVLDLTIGWLGWFLLSVVFVMYELTYVEAIQHAMLQSAAFMLGLLGYMAGLMLFFYGFVWPQRIATRIRQALAEPESEDQTRHEAVSACT